MPIDPVAPASGAGLYTAQAARAPKQVMDGEVFMSLLVTQLRNQDPSSPMDTNAMISQTTQLAMMEQMTASAKTSEENFSLQMRSAAAALIGRTASYAGTDGSDVTGEVTAVSFTAAVPTVTIGGRNIPLDALSGIQVAAS